MTASELLNLLAERLGSDLCKQFVIPEIVSLAEDPVFRVRKAAALSFHRICKVGGEHELFERLMPAFVRLSKDDMYRVRKAVAQSLSEVSKSVSDDIRIGVLIEIFLRLALDPSRQVKQCVLQQAGMFIATLPHRATSESVLKYFYSMASAPTNDLSTDAELREYCAYYFPGVLHTIGGKRWPEMREVYQRLVQSRDVNVRRSLSLSLHEIARLLHEGGYSVDAELLPVFEDMIQVR
jgi:serine/threonine-protein phosphatase 4 regulatory subunit 1